MSLQSRNCRSAQPAAASPPAASAMQISRYCACATAPCAAGRARAGCAAAKNHAAPEHQPQRREHADFRQARAAEIHQLPFGNVGHGITQIGIGAPPAAIPAAGVMQLAAAAQTPNNAQRNASDTAHASAFHTTSGRTARSTNRNKPPCKWSQHDRQRHGDGARRSSCYKTDRKPKHHHGSASRCVAR